MQKCRSNHDSIIGGDCNEDIYSASNNCKRKRKLLELMSEFQLVTNSKGPTFINVSGVYVSEIDYCMHTNSTWPTSKRITDLPVNVSDHHPILLEVECHIS